MPKKSQNAPKNAKTVVKRTEKELLGTFKCKLNLHSIVKFFKNLSQKHNIFINHNFGVFIINFISRFIDTSVLTIRSRTDPIDDRIDDMHGGDSIFKTHGINTVNDIFKNGLSTDNPIRYGGGKSTVYSTKYNDLDIPTKYTRYNIIMCDPNLTRTLINEVNTKIDKYLLHLLTHTLVAFKNYSNALCIHMDRDSTKNPPKIYRDFESEPIKLSKAYTKLFVVNMPA